jgi:tetratricopeptide (TPR) repeat protein
VLAIASKELHKCNVVDSHFYHREHRSCYWCERKASGSLDVFELNTQVSQQSHSQYNNNSQKKINNPSSNYSQHSSNTKTLLQNSNQPYVPPAQNVTVHQTRSASIVRVLALLVIGLGAFVVISPMIYYSLPPQLRRIISGKVASDFFNDALRKQNSGDNQGAIADYTEAIRLKPDYAHAYNNRGNAKSALGNFQGAIADYTEAIRLKPDFANARYNLGLSQQRIGLLNEAMSQFLKASSLYEAQGNTEWYNKSLAKVRALQDQGAGYE